MKQLVERLQPGLAFSATAAHAHNIEIVGFNVYPFSQRLLNSLRKKDKPCT